MGVDTIVCDAVRIFESNIYNGDRERLGSRSVQDVVDAASIIEREREDRDALCNLRRIEPLVEGLQTLGEVMRKLIQCTYPEYYIWGPVKLALEIANEDDAALDAILDAYSRLTSSLRFLKKINAVARLAGLLQEVVAYTFSDVLDYHRYIYQALRKGGWKILFNASWGELAPVFDCIIKRLDRNRSLVDQAQIRHSNAYEAVNISGNATAHLGDQLFEIEHATFVPSEDFSAAQQFREKILEDLQARQKQRKDHQLRECIKWLELQSHDRDQANIHSRRRDAREESTCEWILSHPKMKSWLDPDSTKPFLWLKGNPGSGKTTLATYIIDHAKLPNGSLMLYYLCSQEIESNVHDVPSVVLSILAAQILRSKRHLVPFVFETYVKNAEQPSLKLPVLVRQLLSCLASTYVVIDGLNECSSEAQDRLFNRLEWIVAHRRDEGLVKPEVKILICSQDAKGIPHKLRKQPFISLSEEHVLVSHDIKLYTANSISSLEERFNESVIEKVASNIVAKANGMFLWVKLVVLTVLEQESLLDIENTLHHLPSGLVGVYGMLLRRLEKLADDRQRRRIRMIFYWMLFARRSMKTWEICDALVIGGDGLVLDKNHTMLHPRILDLCKPLIEVHKDQTVSFVHFTVKAFLLAPGSGPFVLESDALTHITMTCLRYLYTCEGFFSGKTSPETYRQIVLQLHSLFPYVAKTWKDHLAALVSRTSPQPETPDVLLSRLISTGESCMLRGGDQYVSQQQCQQDQQRLFQQNPSQIFMNNDLISHSIIEDLRVTPLDTEPREQLILADEGKHRSVKQAFQCFQDQFEQLLRGQCPYSLHDLGVSKLEFDDFHHRHVAAAFLCRWNQCPNSIRGFHDARERDEHEERHRKQFCCPELHCDFQNNGFPSRAALKGHIERYHKILDITPVPPLVLHERQAAKDVENASSQEDCTQISKATFFDLDLDDFPANLKHQGQDWVAVFNPNLPRMLDVTLVHDFLHRSVVTCVRFSPDGNYVATGCNRGAQIFDIRYGTKVCELIHDELTGKDNDNYIRSLCFSPDGRILVTGAGDKRIRLWDIKTLKIICHFDGHEEDVYGLDFSRSGRVIASGSDDKTVRLWNTDTRDQSMIWSVEHGVTTVAISPNGQYVAAGLYDNSVRVWDVSTGYELGRLEGGGGHKDFVHSVAFSPSGRELISGSFDKTIKLWELGRDLLPNTSHITTKCIRTFEGHKDYVLSVCMTPDGRWIISGSKDNGVHFWDPDTGNAHLILRSHKNSVISVAAAPTGNLFATGSGDKRVCIWRYGPYR